MQGKQNSFQSGLDVVALVAADAFVGLEGFCLSRLKLLFLAVLARVSPSMVFLFVQFQLGNLVGAIFLALIDSLFMT